MSEGQTEKAPTSGTVDWYFDIVSPFAYFSCTRLKALPEGTAIRPRPILFAGLLGHWGQKGPAEIPPKRTWTYRWCTWVAQRDGIAFQPPAAHPFNPLPYLRLCILLEGDLEAIRRVFEAVWTTGADAADPAHFASLAESLGFAADAVQAPEVKRQLASETAQAAECGVFGVPTFMVGDTPFWGYDAMDFAAACLRDPSILSQPEMRRAEQIPQGVQRR